MAKKDTPRYVSTYDGQDIGIDETRNDDERETAFYFADNERLIHMHTFNSSLMRAFLDTDGFVIAKDGVELVNGKVVSLKGELPIQMLSFKKARSSASFGRIVSPAVRTLKNVPSSGKGIPEGLRKYREAQAKQAS